MSSGARRRRRSVGVGSGGFEGARDRPRGSRWLTTARLFYHAGDRPAAGARPVRRIGRQRVKIALGQINPTVGDFDGNRRLVLDAAGRGEARGAELAIFPELALCGYPPKDLLERPAFVDAARASLDALAARAGRARDARPCWSASPSALPTRAVGRGLANSAALIDGGRVAHVDAQVAAADLRRVRRVALLRAGHRGRAGRRSAAGSLGISICEDIWNDADFWPHRLYRADPDRGAGARAAPSSSSTSRPRRYTIEKRHLRPRMLAATARRWRRPLVFVNQVGGQDDLVFDGASLALDAARRGRRARRRARDRSDRRRRGGERGGGELRPFDELRRALGAGGAGARHPRLRAPLRLLARAARASRAASTRRWWPASPRARSARATCSAWPCRRATRLPDSRADAARAGREPGHRLHGDLHRADVRRLPRHAGARARRLRARRRARGGRRRRRSDRPEPAGAHPRRHPDGAVQPAGSAAAHAPATRARSPPATARSTATWPAAWR